MKSLADAVPNDDEWVIVDGVRYEPRHKVIEECARTVDRFDGDVLASTEDGRWVRQSEVAAAIRALKEGK